MLFEWQLTDSIDLVIFVLILLSLPDNFCQRKLELQVTSKMDRYLVAYSVILKFC